jgi:hypothetical protein
MIRVSRRGTVVCANAGVLVTQFDRDVEVLGPEADGRRGIGGRRDDAELSKDRGSKAVPIAQRPRCRRIDLERLVPEVRIGRQQSRDRLGRCGEAAQGSAPLAGALGVDELGALDPDLVAKTVVLENWRAETARGRFKRDLVVRLAGRSDDLFGDSVQRGDGRGEARGKRRQSRQIAQEATGSRGGWDWCAETENCIAPSSTGECLIARVSTM